MSNIPSHWPNLVKFLEEYTSAIVTKIVLWRMPETGYYKCNTDGVSKGNPGPSSSGFCVRDALRNFLYAESIRLPDGSNLLSEAKALKAGLELCINRHFMPVVMETDFLIMKNVLDNNWGMPWSIDMELKSFNQSRSRGRVMVEHVYREGNQVADYFANPDVHFAAVVISSSTMAKQVLKYQDRFVPDAVQAHNHYKFSMAWLPVCPQWRTLRRILNTSMYNMLDANQQKVKELIAYCAKCSQEGEALEIVQVVFKTNLNLLSNTLFSKDLVDPFSNAKVELKDVICGIMTVEGKPNLVDFFPILKKIDLQGIRHRTFIYFEITERGKSIEEVDVSRLPYLQCIIKETLRMHPPSQFLGPRKVERDVELCGYIIPKGLQVLVNVWEIGRNSTFWKDPLVFKFEKFWNSNLDVRVKDFELIPFGAGRRMCPVSSLALRMVPVMLGSLLNSFNWKLEGDNGPAELDMEERFGLTLAKVHPLFRFFKIADVRVRLQYRFQLIFGWASSLSEVVYI
ncbi:Geraniol 8-hydroxylase [Capsicum baccatum]|uniref:Geraniol 8-hydroxylase n=1 Tax=Capsicum baccatum TaxID=33114 RepID=A0A2G2W2C6_CAPBA|nr:Geraniol 8-hydroxylase [Capsicum baccatum]